MLNCDLAFGVMTSSWMGASVSVVGRAGGLKLGEGDDREVLLTLEEEEDAVMERKELVWLKLGLIGVLELDEASHLAAAA